MKYLSSFLLYHPSHLSYLSSYFITKSLLIFSDLSSINPILEISPHLYIFQWTFNFTRYIFSTEYRGDFYPSLLYFLRYLIFLLTFLILQNTYSTMWYYVRSSSVVLLERLKLFSFSLDVPLKTSNYTLLIDGINYRSLFTRRLTYIIFHDAELSFPFLLCILSVASAFHCLLYINISLLKRYSIFPFGLHFLRMNSWVHVILSWQIRNNRVEIIILWKITVQILSLKYYYINKLTCGGGEGKSVKRFQRRDVYTINVSQLKLFTLIREARRKCNLNINLRKQRRSAEKICHRKQKKKSKKFAEEILRKLPRKINLRVL